MCEIRSNDNGLPILAEEAASLVAWIKQQGNPLEAARVFVSSVQELAEDNRAVPAVIIEVANRCRSASLGGDYDAAQKAVEDAAAIIMEMFSL